MMIQDEETKGSRSYETAEFDPARDYKIHPCAMEGGGLNLRDQGNLVPDAFKAVLKKTG